MSARAPHALRPGSRARACDSAAAAAACLAAVATLSSGCTIPITAQTLTGGALNAGALLFVDRYNDGPGDGTGSYAYYSPLEAEALRTLFEDAIERGNRRHLYATPRPVPLVAERDTAGAGAAAERGGDEIVLARASGRAWRPDDPPRPETFPQRQWTPAPLFSVASNGPEARGDTLMWVVTHRATRQAAFLLVPHEEATGTRVSLVPYDPPTDILLSVPNDHAQRNAVEALHQAFYFAAVDRFGPEALVRAGSADR